VLRIFRQIKSFVCPRLTPNFSRPRPLTRWIETSILPIIFVITHRVASTFPCEVSNVIVLKWSLIHGTASVFDITTVAPRCSSVRIVFLNKIRVLRQSKGAKMLTHAYIIDLYFVLKHLFNNLIKTLSNCPTNPMLKYRFLK